MAGNILEQMAKKQAERLEKQYGSSAYGGTTWLNEQLNGKKKKKKDDEDIAPVRTTTTTTKQDDRKWFEKGAFEDGYQFGDVVKTLLGTDKDILDNMGQGARKMAENVVDAGLTGVGWVAEKFGADAFASKVKDAVAKDFSTDSSKLLAPIAKTLLNTPVMQPVNMAVKGVTGLNKVLNGEEDNSVLGEKSDSLVQSATQFAIQSGLTTVGVPWYLTAGVTSFGGEAENAFRQGATYNQAALSGVISAGSEILTEKLFGGSGLGEKGLINLEPLTKGITNKVVKTIADYGIDLMAEGSEEVVSQVIGNLGSALYKEENLSDILLSEEALDGYIESFVGGMVISGGANVGKVSNSIKTGRDYRSGLSANEQAVVSKEVENRIAEQEQDGKKLTKDEKAAIEDAVIREMEKGYISTETIEEVLGGEDFKNYQTFAGEESRLVEQEKSLKEEFDALNKMKQIDMTGEEIDRRLELKSQLEDIRKQITGINESGTKDALQQTLSNRVMELTKNDRLAESYNERSRRGQAYQADISKYDAKQQATIQKAIDSGILNNTNRTHEFVDLIAKITADKGVLFDFTNNERLKESGFALDGKTVNGYVTKDGVTLNIDSAKSLNSVVGHEITHVLEGTEMYTALQSVVTEYAKTKGEYQGRYDALAKLYEGVEGADINAELTADLVGDYLFSDTDFVKHLSVTNRNVFQKIYDEIKYLCKVATAGSKEARELEKAKRVFAEVYKATKNTAAQSGVKYSMSGVNAETADSVKLMTAEEMLAEGVDSETIRQETGWFKGYDGKWRFEIDDSKMEITKNLTSPFYAKYIDGEALKLDDIIKHDALFAAYPKLRDTSVRLKHTLGKGVVGTYNATTDTLDVSASIYLTEDMFKEMLVHEIQHKIQNIESFARGSSPKYWETKGISEAEYERFVAKSEHEKAKILRGLTTEERQDYLRYVETDKQVRDALNALDTDAILRGDDTNAMNTLNSVDAIEAENDALYNKLYSADWFAKLQEIDNMLEEGISDKLYTVFYKNTAGEIEARDVSKRVNYTEEQRKNIRPDIDKSIVTFANNDNSLAYIGDTKDGRRCYQSGFDSSVSMDDRIAVFKNRIATIFNLGAVELKTDVKKIRILGDKFTSQKNIYGDDMAQPGEKEAKVNSLYDLADILATATYDPSATTKEPSYANPALEPKNKAHKDVKYWYKFRNEIVFDGVPYTVTFNIRDKGSEQYQYLIDFKENKTPGLSNTAVKSLLRADQASYTDSIAPYSENVKYSLSDSDGGQLSKEQQEFFKDSKMRDENGNLKVMYRGDDADIAVFDRTKSKYSNLYGRGFYFTDSESHAKQYGNAKAYYLDIKNPVSTTEQTITKDQMRKFLEAVAENEDDYSFENYGYGATVDSVLGSVYSGKSDFAMLYDVSQTAIGDMVAAVELFNEVNGTEYDGLILDTETVVFQSNQIKRTDNQTPTADSDVRRSLSSVGEQPAPVNGRGTFGKDIALETAPAEEVAPVQETVAENATVEENLFPDDAYAPIADDPERFDSLDDADAPPVQNMEYGERGNPMTMPKTTVNMIADNVRESLWVDDRQIGKVRSLIEEYGKQEFPDRNWLFRELKDNFGKHTEKMVDETTQEVKSVLRKYRLNVSDTIKGDIADYNDFRRRNFGKVLFSRQGMSVDSAYEELSSMYPSFFPADIANPTDQLLQIVNVANMSGTTEQSYELDDDTVWDVVDDIAEAVSDYQYIQMERDAGKAMPKESFDDLVQNADAYAPLIVRDTPAASGKGFDAPTYDAQPSKGVVDGQQSLIKEEPKPETEDERRQTRKQLHQNIVDGVKADFKAKGFDFDKVLKNAKNLGTFATVDNTPQRVMEKALGYKEGQTLSDLTVNKVAQNETEGIKWLNSYTDRKSGLLKQLSARYNIKPGSKESAAAQMYAEGFYVAENNDIIAYGDAELAKDFPDARVQANIKGLAKDPRIRQIYDDTLAMINASRTRNAYPEIPRLDNYFLHFRAMDDTFSKLGLPFNPNDIRAKDLPTDLNGVTADLKPGQPYFASAMHRTGKRTSFDLLGGLERYLSSAKNQIYHIDDIQTLRALRNYIADTYGQANGLEGLDALSEEEAQDRIEKVYNSHLSTFAKFLNEEANILAGKTALIDRGLEGIIGRRGITFLDTVNRQVGSNMVGFNISSSLTNFLPVVQTIAKTNKADFVKAFAQTAGYKIGSLVGITDNFAENSPVIIRRKGADRFYRTPWQKAGDFGYVFMSAVDDISTEMIARTKYNELTRKGMDAQKAHYETDKWVSRLMGDRSLGQMPQLYNSKMLGLITKFQLEVRNQLDSQFYDTIQEAKVSTEHIENRLARNAKMAAKVTSTFVQLAVGQHLFGKAFESVFGYNPAFDIIGVLIKAFGFDDEEDSEDTVLDNVEQAFLELLGDLPYASVFTDGGRVPISSALPIGEFIKGEDEWGNEKSRWKTLGEAAPYYVLPGGYGQIKKTKKGLEMFSDEHPIAGSYTDSGNLRFPVEDNLKNRVQAAVAGQWANENARYYFDNEIAPLKPKQIEEFIDVDIPIRDYWEYRKGLSGLSKLEEKADYIAGLDLPIDKKNLLINNIADRKEDIDMTGYDDYAGFEEFDFAVKNPEKYEIAKKVGGYEAYKKYQDGMKDMKLAEKVDYIAGLDLTTEQKNALINGETDRKEPIDLSGYDTSAYSSFEEFEYAKEYPEKYAVAKAVGGYEAYRGYSSELYDIKADKDEYGKSISGSRKEKVQAYINDLDADYYTKIILWKSEYTSDDTYNQEIVEYLNGRDDISFEETIAILRKLGFDVTDDGDISW